MANVIERQILEEGPRNAVVKVAGWLDASDVNAASIIQLSDFTNNDQGMGALVGLRVNEIEFSVSEPLVVQAAWNAATPQMIANVAQSGELYWAKQGGLLPDQTRSGYDGSINVKTGGYVGGTTRGFTLTFKLVKLYN
mgnify:CR=1 FL=1